MFKFRNRHVLFPFISLSVSIITSFIPKQRYFTKINNCLTEIEKTVTILRFLAMGNTK